MKVKAEIFLTYAGVLWRTPIFGSIGTIYSVTEPLAHLLGDLVYSHAKYSSNH
jgi:hypothetical protein